MCRLKQPLGRICKHWATFCLLTSCHTAATTAVSVKYWHLDKKTGCWPGLYFQFTSPTVHHKNGATYSPLNTREKIVPAGTNPSPSFLFFCCWWFTSANFHYMWTNSEARTNQQSTYWRLFWIFWGNDFSGGRNLKSIIFGSVFDFLLILWQRLTC